MRFLFRTLAVTALAISALSTVPGSANTGNFDEYAEGAMTIYSKFTKPSVEESEQFYAFIKDKWQKADCAPRQCEKDGKNAGVEYAVIYQVPIEDNHGL